MVASATIGPKKLGLPFTHWSVRKLTAYLGGRYGHHDPSLVPARAVRIGWERVRRILHEHDVSFQRTWTWKTSTDPACDAELERIEEVMSRFPDRCFAFDQFGPLSVRPCPGPTPPTTGGTRVRWPAVARATARGESLDRHLAARIHNTTNNTVNVDGAGRFMLTSP